MDYTPTVRGRRLMRELTRLRHAQGMSLDTAALQLGFSKSKLYRIENGRARITLDDLNDMLDLYSAGCPQREALIQLCRDARRRGWWTAYSDAFSGSYIGLESEASLIKVNAHLVPGFLQTPDYARAMIGATGPWLDAASIDRRVTARTARQQALLDRPEPPRIHVVIDEAVLRRIVAGPGAMADQIAALAAAAERPNLIIQVLPFIAGAAGGLDSEFVILHFPDPADPPVVYLEGPMGDIYLESADEIDRCNLAWTSLVSQAASPVDSMTMIAALAAKDGSSLPGSRDDDMQ
jgi:transcriptional regulator with XRE-family HTH domain